MDVLCFELINSERHDHCGSGRSEDRLSDPDWLVRFLNRWGLAAVEAPDGGELESLVQLRHLLRRIVDAVAAGEPPADADADALNRVLQAAPTSRRLVCCGKEGYRLQLTPVRQDWPWVLAEIAASFAELLGTGDLRRIKICENPDCRWVFFDESKCCGKRWCDDGCANLMKVRRFRKRQRAEEAGA
ncbi:CGNR zinc finger domain-containing protein [Gloeobacter morelensis]|uniref:ABATE domain-containing protein n=1 Tax=Gloeobacter morelensis MG652769 TaxID=2781736 RepID=A0ABY3PFW0_9CYAN|nr:ABATE domain-containing protein [Gloeobacter morelensis]UFP92551.1 ABATE domain-containing protein [Gloeobacter morelensis MG652769]